MEAILLPRPWSEGFRLGTLQGCFERQRGRDSGRRSRHGRLVCEAHKARQGDDALAPCGRTGSATADADNSPTPWMRSNNLLDSRLTFAPNWRSLVPANR